MALAEGGDEVHVISYALPSRLSFINPRIFFHEVVTPTYPLFDNYPPYSLALSTKMVEVAPPAPARLAPRPLPHPDPRPGGARPQNRRAAAAAGGDHAPRHRR